MKDTILKIKNLNKTYQAKNGEVEALKDISFDIKEGEFVSIIGPSGCGKSTLLSIISGLEKKSSGEVEIHKKLGYMLQKDNLLEWRSILNNVLLGIEIQKQKTKENIEYAEELLKKYEAEGTLDKKVSCVITDIEMPQMDGHRLTKLIKTDKKFSHLPINRQHERECNFMVGIRPTYKTERNRAILLARREGRTYRSIGEEHGIRAETVRPASPMPSISSIVRGWI